jgi:hypothetical protein
MRVNRWELALSLVGLAFASIFVFSNVWGLGIALVCVDALWLLTRLEIVEKQSGPGRYATLQGRLGAVRLFFILGIYAAVIYGLFIVRHDLSGKTRVALIADFGLAGFAFMLLGELQRSGDDTLNWLFGARAERKVGLPLNQFADRGWLVLHGYKKDRGGDIDHVLCGPNGAFIVETKSYGFRQRDVRQTALNAWWLRQKLGVPWVTGVLCVDEDRPPEQRDRIWVVSHRDLIGWLEAQRNQPVDPEQARITLLA